jgi:hypothetical protein
MVNMSERRRLPRNASIPVDPPLFLYAAPVFSGSSYDVTRTGISPDFQEIAWNSDEKSGWGHSLKLPRA